MSVNDPVTHSLHPFPSQYVAKNSSELHQRAAPKPSPALTAVDERDDSVERRAQRIPTIDPVVTDTVPQAEDVPGKAQPGGSTSEPNADDAAAQKDSASPDETPHVHEETDEARDARLDRQWKLLKVDVAELPDIYAKLAKINLTGNVPPFFILNYPMEIDACKE